MSAALHVRFPGLSFISQTEFDGFCRDSQKLLDARFLYEQMLVAGGTGVRDGSCAPCLRAARYSSVHHDTPGWRDGQLCDCEAPLSQRARAMLHFLEAEAGLDAWSRLLILGPATPLDARLAEGRPQPRHLRHLLSDEARGYRLDAADGAFTLALAWDYLHRIPPLSAALSELRRTLAPGGVFVFTLPFHYRESHTVSRLSHIPRRGGRLPAEFRGEIHEIGWDILERLREAGFADAQAHHYWSDELGYLGAFNLLFSASA